MVHLAPNRTQTARTVGDWMEEPQAECWAELAEQIRSESRTLRQQSEALLVGTDHAPTPDATPRRPVLAPPAAAPPPERIYVYAPRENKCSRFSGERSDQARPAEDWIKEIRKALVGQPLTPSEQVTWVVDLLDGEAKREVTFSLDLEQVCIE